MLEIETTIWSEGAELLIQSDKESQKQINEIRSKRGGLYWDRSFLPTCFFELIKGCGIKRGFRQKAKYFIF